MYLNAYRSPQITYRGNPLIYCCLSEPTNHGTYKSHLWLPKVRKRKIAFRTYGYQKYERGKSPFALVVTKSTKGKNRLSFLWLPKVRKAIFPFRTYGCRKDERGKSHFALMSTKSRIEDIPLWLVTVYYEVRPNLGFLPFNRHDNNAISDTKQLTDGTD